MKTCYRNGMANTDYRESYRGLSKEQLLEEKQKLESTIRNQTHIWESTNLATSILLIVFGSIFAIILLGIPFLVVGIMGLNTKIRVRYRANQAINEAKARLAAVEDCLAEKDQYEDDKKKAIEAEIV